MMRKTVLLVISLLLIDIAIAQWTEKLKMTVGAGAAQPDESFILSDYSTTFTDIIVQSYPGVTEDEVLPSAPKSSASDFDKYWDTGLNIASGLEYNVHRIIAIQFGFNYSLFSFNQKKLKQDLKDFYKKVDVPIALTDFSAERGSVSIYSVGAAAKVALPIPLVTPYIIGGGGYLRLQQEPIEISNLTDPLGASFSYKIPEKSSDSFMGIAGGGITTNLIKNIQPFLEGNYLLGLTEDDDTIYYTIRAGFLFSFTN